MLYDEITHSKSQNQNGVQLAIPVQNVMMKEPKHQLKSPKEVRQRAQNCKANLTIQQMGLSQEISDGTFVTVANPNRLLFHCGFYKNGHKYPGCGND